MGQWASTSSTMTKTDLSSKSELSYRSERKVAKLRASAEASGTRKAQRRIGQAYGARCKKHMANISSDIAWKRERKLRNRRRIQDSFLWMIFKQVSKSNNGWWWLYVLPTQNKFSWKKKPLKIPWNFQEFCHVFFFIFLQCKNRLMCDYQNII